MFIRPTNDMTYLTGDEGQKFCGVFSENGPLQLERFQYSTAIVIVGHFTPRKTRMRIILEHAVEAAILFPFQ